MPTVSWVFPASGADVFTSVQPPELLLENNTGGGTAANAVPELVYAFDAATLEAIYFSLVAWNYGSGNVSVLVDWYATATTGSVVWGSSMLAQTPGDAQSVLTDALATAATTTTSASGTASGPTRTTVTISSLDSLASNDVVRIKVYRDAANGSDTMAGDAKIRLVTVQYSDT